VGEGLAGEEVVLQPARARPVKSAIIESGRYFILIPRKLIAAFVEIARLGVSTSSWSTATI
jgi:hypothetical protein